MNEINKLFEAFSIRMLWVLYAMRVRRTPGLCPPKCAVGHTYQWPCRARIKAPSRKQSARFSHWNTVHMDEQNWVGTMSNLREEDNGLKVDIKLNETWEYVEGVLKRKPL